MAAASPKKPIVASKNEPLPGLTSLNGSQQPGQQHTTLSGPTSLATSVVMGQAGDNVPESMKRLRALKEKIQQEFLLEHKERVEHENREVIVPLSLAGDYGQASGKKMAGKSGGVKSGGAAVDKYALLPKDKIQGMKQLDKYLQREIEGELEKKAQEAASLKAQNQRLREIVSLRQESNARKEQKLESEMTKLKALTDETCVDTTNHFETMARLKEMNSSIQDGAAKLRSTIEAQSEAERMALIRTYRVRMREVKQQLQAQEALNLDGASAWINRYNILDADREAAEVGLKMLDSRNKLLQADNSELKIMHKHQEEQRTLLTTKIAVIRRENKRLKEQIGRVEEDLAAAKQPAMLTPTRLVQSRGSSRESARPWAMTDERRQGDALAKLRRVLEDMRRSLRNVRSAHVELLQERTELELFLRQCIEDVRRDIYRFTVVNNVSRNIKGDQLEERMMLQDYGVKDRRRLIDILNSKLHVLTVMHSRMFPNKIGSAPAELLGEFLPSVGSDSSAAGNGAAAGMDVAKAIGVAAEHDMDTLWSKWKEWTRSVTPDLP